MAVKESHKEIVEYLVSKADINIKDIKGVSTHMYK